MSIGSIVMNWSTWYTNYVLFVKSGFSYVMSYMALIICDYFMYSTRFYSDSLCSIYYLPAQILLDVSLLLEKWQQTYPPHFQVEREQLTFTGWLLLNIPLDQSLDRGLEGVVEGRHLPDTKKVLHLLLDLADNGLSLDFSQHPCLYGFDVIKDES